MAQNAAELAVLQYKAVLAAKPSIDNGLFGFMYLIYISCCGTECEGLGSAAIRSGAGCKARERGSGLFRDINLIFTPSRGFECGGAHAAALQGGPGWGLAAYLV